MKRIILAIIFIANTAIAGKMEIVDLCERSGWIEQIQAEFKKQSKIIEARLEKENINTKYKTFIIDILNEISNDRELARELIKIDVDIQTENMTNEQIENYQKQLQNPVLQITNQLMIASKISQNLAYKEKLKKLISGIQERTTEEQFKHLLNEIQSDTNKIAIVNRYKAEKLNLYEEDIKNAILNMVFGNRIVIEIREKRVETEKKKI